MLIKASSSLGQLLIRGPVSSESDTYLLGLVRGKSVANIDISSNMSLSSMWVISSGKALPLKWFWLIQDKLKMYFFAILSKPLS